MSERSPEPLSEEELADLERVGNGLLKRYGAELPQDLPETRLTLRLIATVRASQESAKALAEALEKIRDGKNPDGGECLCTHETEDCCVKADYFCPFCIASVALAYRGTAAPGGGKVV